MRIVKTIRRLDLSSVSRLRGKTYATCTLRRTSTGFGSGIAARMVMTLFDIIRYVLDLLTVHRIRIFQVPARPDMLLMSHNVQDISHPFLF